MGYPLSAPVSPLRRGRACRPSSAGREGGPMSGAASGAALGRQLSRRHLLKVSGGLAMAGLTAGCASPIASSLTGSQPATADVIYWHLFGGGDGENMATMVSDVQKS